MRKAVPFQILLELIIAFFSFHYYICESTSSQDPQPLYPSQAPSPLMMPLPFIYQGFPKLSGLCALNFSSIDSILRATAVDCWSPLAPYLANAVCCPQFITNIHILIAQSSLHTQKLALNNKTQATHCLSDVEHILESHGASENLSTLCSFHPSNLTNSSCPIIDMKNVERVVGPLALLAKCADIDPSNECCNNACSNTILNAAEKLAMGHYRGTGLGLDGAPAVQQSNVVSDCKSVVLRWLATNLDPTSANRVLRGIASCNINKDCPLLLPDLKNVSNECGNVMSNQKACCQAMDTYLSSLQNQTFLTALQALHCAESLGIKLQKANVSTNIYQLCQTRLKDFSLQVDSKASGCLLPSLPSDVTFDRTTGISFICDLNDNVLAPWPSNSSPSTPYCNKTTKLPELPKVTSAQNGFPLKDGLFTVFFASIMVLKLLI